MKHYADCGINWIFVYAVLHEDDCIIILKDLGRFHKFDEDRKFDKKIDGWIEIRGDYVFINNTKKLVEIC